jgi:hypothetical protein
MSEVKISATVTQEELQKIAEHRREIAWHTSQLGIIEQDVMALLRAGALVEKGRFVARMAFRSFHKAAWKAIVMRELGEEFAAKEFKNAPVVTTARLEVIEHPPLPLLDGYQD